MGFTFLKKLPTPAEIRNQYPIDAAIQELKAKRDQEIRDVFTGKSDKFLAIIGPCSADNEDAVCDYLLRLRKVQDKIADKVLIIPRVYTNKPRTTGEGYKGMVHQPDPEKAPDMLAGLIAIRKMHIHAIQESGFTCADEMLYPENYRYLSDILSYVAVGALLYIASPFLAGFISGSDNAVIIDNASRYLRISSLFYPILGMLFIFRNSLQGLGKKLTPLTSSFIELFGKILFVLLVIPSMGYLGVILCEPLIWIPMTIQLYFALRKHIKRLFVR